MGQGYSNVEEFWKVVSVEGVARKFLGTQSSVTWVPASPTILVGFRYQRWNSSTYSGPEIVGPEINIDLFCLKCGKVCIILFFFFSDDSDFRFIYFFSGLFYNLKRMHYIAMILDFCNGE